MEFHIAMKEKTYEEGLSRAEVCDLYDMLSGTDVIPYEVVGENSTALGFISIEALDLMGNYYQEGSPLYQFIKEILDDMEKEDESCSYLFEGKVRIWLSRD